MCFLRSLLNDWRNRKTLFFRIAKRAGDPTNLAVKDLVLLTASFQMFVIFPSLLQQFENPKFNYRDKPKISRTSGLLGHPNKRFRFPSPDRPIFSKSEKKTDSLVKEASTLIYKHTILLY